MILLLFSILLVNYLFISPRRSNILYCGIFGWNGLSSKSVSVDKLKLLGIYNDPRGGQSIGMYMNKKVFKSVHPYDKFKDYWEHNIFKEEIEHPLVIGHSRRASIGHITVANAQPVVVNLVTGNKKSKMTLAHNGTITNFRKLADDYDVDVRKLTTDSQVLAALLLSDGPKVLEKYIGGASLLYTTKEDPDVMYVFRGMSSIYEDGKHLNEERPLHYYQEHKNSIYFSSEKGALVAIAKSKDLIKEVPGNVLFKVQDGKMTKVLDINRDNASQKGKFTTQYGGGYNHEREANIAWERNNSNRLNTKKEIITKVQKAEQDFLDDIDNNAPVDLIYFVKGRYYIDGKEAHGAKIVSNYGLVYSEKELLEELDEIPGELSMMYFFKGFLMQTKEAMTKLMIAEADKKLIAEGTKDYYRFLCQYSIYPVGPKDYSFDYMIQKETTHSTHPGYFDGKLQPLFSNFVYEFKMGEIKGVELEEESYYPEHFEDLMNYNPQDVAKGDFLYTTHSLDEKLVLKLTERVKELHKIKKDNEVEDSAGDSAIAQFELDAVKTIQKELIELIGDKAADLGMNSSTEISASFIKILEDAKEAINNFEHNLVA